MLKTMTMRVDPNGLIAGISAWRIWTLLAWQDIKMRYRGSVLGPLWMVANLGIVVVGVTILYSELLNQPVHTFMPYLVVSLLVMNFIWPVLIEGCHAFANSP